MKFWYFLILVASSPVYAYEYSTHETLLQDIRAISTDPSGDHSSVLSFLRKDVQQLPRLSQGSTSQQRIVAFLGFMEELNRALQVHTDDTDIDENSPFCVLYVASVVASAKSQDTIQEFADQLDKSDPTYPVRMAGLQKMRHGVLAMLQSTILMTGESRVADEAKVYMLDNIATVIPMFEGHIDDGYLKSLQNIIKRYDLSDQSYSVLTSYAKFRKAISSVTRSGK